MQYVRVLSTSKKFFMFEGHTKLFKSIGSLKLLRYLDLSYNKEIKEIPDTIGKLYNLQTLLSRSCENLAKLPDSIGNLKQLRYLDLSESSIEKIPDTICNLHELRTLSLSYCKELTQLPTNISMLTNLCKLDNTVTSFKKMPPKISNLKNLRSLPEFVAGKMNDIEELGELPDLHGRLCIRSLENVEEVSKAILKNKNHITRLELEWNYDITDVSREVLDRLQPHTNIKELRIRNYGGRSFPDWIGHHSFSCIREVVLNGCKNCDRLPPLGELPSLEVLTIKKFDVVERIGDEFYLNDSSSSSSSASCVTEPPFKSLKKLVFENMGEWKEWSLVGGAFPNLKTLYLWDCPKLKGECLPDNYHVVDSLSTCQYPSLRELKIGNCPGMKSFPQGRLPSTIQTITIWGCDDLELFSEEGWPCSNLKSLDIRRCKKLFAHGNKWNLGMLTSLTSLHIFGDGLESLSEEGLPCSNLKSLEIGNCQKLFAHSNKWNLGMLTSLTSLEIHDMDMEGVDSFPEEEGQLPTTLTSLRLLGLRNLKSLNGTALRHLTSLQTLCIYDCQQLQCLPEEGLPASLSALSISLCPLLKPRCQRGIGQDWDKIHYISKIWII